MAEGGEDFEEHEMEDFNKYKSHTEEIQEIRQLLDRAKDRARRRIEVYNRGMLNITHIEEYYGDDDMPEGIRVRYDGLINDSIRIKGEMDEVEDEIGEIEDDIARRLTNQEETSFIDSDNGKTVTVKVNTGEKRGVDDVYEDVPNVKRLRSTISSSITNDKKDFFKKALRLDIRVGDGPSSKKLIRESNITLGVNGKQDGVVFEDKKVVVSRDRGKSFHYSIAKGSAETVKRFKQLVEEAKKEHSNTLSGVVDAQFRSEDIIPTEDLTDSIVSSVI